MNSAWRRRFIVALGPLLVAGCGSLPKSVVVLLEDERPSAVEVRTAGGTQVLSQPGQAVDIGSVDRAPGAPFVPTEQEVRAAFAGALAAEPEAPETFLLYFHSDTTTLTDESAAVVPRIVAAIRRRTIYETSVVGHTDRYGDDGYNRDLSRKRAAVIRDTLVGAGIPADHIEIDYHGENNPLVVTPDEVREPRNRRVEVTIR